MKKQVQIRRGTQKACDAFVGAQGELLYATDTKHLSVHDGEKSGGMTIPNNEDFLSVVNSTRYALYHMCMCSLIVAHRNAINEIEALERKRSREDGYYKYVVTENSHSTTFYSWPNFFGERHTCTMDGLIQMDLDRDAEREAERLPDDPQITPSTYYQTRVAGKCRLINYPGDLLPITEEEKTLWNEVKTIKNDIKELQDRFCVKDDEDSSEQ